MRVVGAAALLVACEDGGSGGDGGPASATVTQAAAETPAASPPPGGGTEQCPVGPEVCGFALEVAAAIGAADFDRLANMGQPSTYTCPGGTPQGLGGPFPLCAASAAGEVREGYSIHRLQSDGGTVESSFLPALRLAVLEGGHGLGPYVAQPRIVGLHCPMSEGPPDCRERAIVYFEGAAHFHIERGDGGWRIRALQFGHTAEDVSVFGGGGALPFPWERLEDGWYYAWRPKYVPDPADMTREEWLLAPPEVSQVTVWPPEGGCPARLTVQVPPEHRATPPKGPAVVEVWVFEGVVGLNAAVSDRSLQRESLRATAVPGTDEFAITLEGSMLGGRLCEADVLTLVTRGDSGPHVGGYRINN